ncbi:MAG: hypothetical protein LUI87_18795 [Lachnospiraceae bacterium]|nr:hypothetical protein [Lachnospiraceae bacterium]
MIGNEKRALRCGAARRVITPPAELLSEVRGLMGTKFTSVSDDIYVRVLAVENVEKTLLFCGFDLDKAPNPERSMTAIAESFGISEECITFYGIHTHTAPALGNREREPLNDPRKWGEKVSEATDRYEAYVHTLLMAAVSEALERLEPATVRFGACPCGCNINRCADYCQVAEDGTVTTYASGGPNPLGPVDHNFYVVTFESLKGKPIAYLMNYAMHNTVMFMNNHEDRENGAISGDVGGNVSQMIEKYFPGSVALWCSGAAGDVSPVRPSLDLHREPEESEAAFAQRQQQGMLTYICNNQYAAALTAIKNASEPFEGTTLNAGLTWLETPGRAIVRIGRWPNQKIEIHSGPDEKPYRIRLHLLQIGRLMVFGIGGELYSSYALKLKEKFPDYDVIVINHDASLIEDANYILDDDAWYRASRVPAGVMSLPGTPPKYEVGYIESALMEAAEQMVAGFEKKN